MKTFAKLGVFSLSGLALAAGVVALSQQPVHARPPRPDCGPTRLWNCVLPGCPDCYEVLFEGTVCEKAAYEKKTGRVCSPEGA